jgi:hypothetical protein
MDNLTLTALLYASAGPAQFESAFGLFDAKMWIRTKETSSQDSQRFKSIWKNITQQQVIPNYQSMD